MTQANRAPKLTQPPSETTPSAPQQPVNAPPLRDASQVRAPDPDYNAWRWFEETLRTEPADGQSNSRTADRNSGPLMAFAYENEAAAIASRVRAPETRRGFAPVRWQRPTNAVITVAAVIFAAGLAAFGWFRDSATVGQAAEARPATLNVNTQPPGAQVLVDGELRGTTPVTLSVNPGAHSLTVRLEGIERAVPLTVAAGSEIGHYFELPTAVSRPATGRMSVATQPAGARITVDGLARGVSPVTISNLSATEHHVKVTSDSGSAERFVTLEPGENTSVLFSLPKKADGIVGGWLVIDAPFDVQVSERNELIGAAGTTKTKIMLAEGRHDVTLANPSLQYQETRSIDVAPGKITSVTVVAPSAALSVNARPWADVMVDGNEIGQTPIANVAVRIGKHEVVLRHPQLGERRQTIVVTAQGPNRLAVDFTK